MLLISGTDDIIQFKSPHYNTFQNNVIIIILKKSVFHCFGENKIQERDVSVAGLIKTKTLRPTLFHVPALYKNRVHPVKKVHQPFTGQRQVAALISLDEHT